MDTPEYAARHRLVYRLRGRASAQACAECGGRARDWATVHGTDGSDPYAHYQPMCRTCHFRYDDVGERAAQKNRGRPAKPEDVARRTAAIGKVIRRNNKSGVPNIYRHSQNGCWHVQVRKINGGSFTNFTAAVAARNALALQIYGLDAKVYPVPNQEK